jgi:hypothetical protein
LYKTAIWGRPYEINHDEHSPYRDLNRAMADWSAGGGMQYAADPREAAHLVLRLVTEGAPELRYPVGPAGDTTAAELITNWLATPWSQIERGNA